ncbi:MAG: hypothetical protein JWQ81_6164 [Amycolatopsis sp.]|uniref:replication-relaxation family protein n=1 Tax=Amycolatopsis sp. TaxID=37632 RepID=UPI00261D01B6|nr:replication-relaxation family protein [Amycolatopsis sp.]MCU1685425.1 hypothetical protein [Amycolatopsis sp.]
MSGRALARRLARQLGPRDIAILRTLLEFRLMQGAQLRRLLFSEGQRDTQTRKARAALQRLTQQKLIVRLDHHRSIGGEDAGSQSHTYGLGGWGHAVLDLDHQTPQRHRRVYDTKPAFAAHALTVSELAVELREQERAGLCEIEELRAEPGAWRRFVGLGGEQRILKPDMFVRMNVGEYELSHFIEVDKDTESLPTIFRKCRVYLDYFRTGQEQQTHGVFPLVWWLVPDRHRLEAIAHTIRRLPADAHALFTVALTSDAVSRLIHQPTEGGAL